MAQYPKISRRDMLKVTSLAAGAAGLAWGRRLFAPPVASGHADDLIPRAFLPLVMNRFRAGMVGKVIHVQSDTATHWQGETRYWEHVDQDKVNQMVDRGIMELTGKPSVASAWRDLLPHYQAGEKIAIKVNFNNTWVCNDTNGVIDALIQPVNAVVASLESIGVSRGDVHVYDAIRAIPAYFASGGLSGIQFFDGSYLGVCRNPAGFSDQPDHYVTYTPPAGVTIPPDLVSDVLIDADYLINMPIMKGGHPLAGVTLGFKNHFGTINDPAGLHNYVNVVSKPSSYRTDYNPLVDLLRSPLIGGKTVLTIGDALFAAKTFNATPQVWTTFGGNLPNSLFFAADPVAIDSVMYDFIVAELGASVPNGANNYLRLAANAGLGIFESANPWTGSYNDIEYRKIVI